MPTQAKSARDFHAKLLLVNAGIFVGLAFQFIRGSPLPAILVTGLVMAVLVNAVMYLSNRFSRRP